MQTNSEILNRSVNRQVTDTSARLAREFASAKPFRHVQIDDFFTPEVSRQLSHDFPAFDERVAINENGDVGSKAVNEKIMHLGPAWEELDELVKDASFRELISTITGIPDLQYDPHYFGGGTHENRHGQGLDAHIDFNYHPITRQHRRLNLIVYLTKDWQDEWGGSIQLHKDPYLPPSQNEIVSIAPQFNRCVIFETNEHSWHGFPRIQIPEDKRSISRRSFALYYYTDTRPEEETGLEHSTIYVDEPLSEEIQAGVALSEEQMSHLHILVGSRDQHLKRLYAHIKQHNTVYNELRAYHEEQMGTLNDLRQEVQLMRRDSEQHLTAANSDIEERDQVISRLTQHLQEMKESTSWRLTWPLRQLKLFLTKRHQKARQL